VDGGSSSTLVLRRRLEALQRFGLRVSAEECTNKAYGFDRSRNLPDRGDLGGHGPRVARNSADTGCDWSSSTPVTGCGRSRSAHSCVRYRSSDRLTIVHGWPSASGHSFVMPVPVQAVLAVACSARASTVRGSLQVAAKLRCRPRSSEIVYHNMTARCVAQLPIPVVDREPICRRRRRARLRRRRILLRRSLAKKLGGFIAYTVSRSAGDRESRRPRDHGSNPTCSMCSILRPGRNWRFGGRWALYSGIPHASSLLSG
jgi:hypothetical protein